ncbi:MAG: ABC transporter permease subunit [Thermoplasmataceae archaeon]
MRLWKSWILARKELAILRNGGARGIAMIVLPLALGVGLPLLIEYLIIKKSATEELLSSLLGAFPFFFIILSALIPLYISSYSIVGEKTEKSLEPLLATPTSDGEILVGKYIGAFLPAIASVYLGLTVYMLLIDLLTDSSFGYLYYPNWTIAIVYLLGTPLASIYGASTGVFVSSKVNSVQGAYQIGVFSLLPLIVIYVLGEIGIVSLGSDTNLLIISGALLVAVVLMYFLSRVTFSRERILTQWK